MKTLTIPTLMTSLLLAVLPARAAIPDDQAVRAIIGEAANQGPEGMLAVACALRNRGTLRGVYGLKSPHVDKQPARIWGQARAAWAQSATNDVTLGATHWENVKAFGRPRWAGSMKATVTVRDHTFFKQ